MLLYAVILPQRNRRLKTMKRNKPDTKPISKNEWAAIQVDRAFAAYASVPDQDRSAERCYYCGSAFAENCTGKCIGQEHS
jgi:hypothetical protein